MDSERKNEITVSANYLADRCLEAAETYHAYSDKDLENATIIFSHFLMDVMWRTNQHLSIEKRGELAKTTGTAIRELIRATTSLDMHEVVRRPNFKPLPDET